MTVGEQVLIFMLVLFRCAAFLAFAPVIGGQQIPRLVKVGLAMSLAWLWVGEAWGGGGTAAASVHALAVGQHAAGVDLVAFTFAVCRETALGAAMGFLLSLIMTPARIAGAYLGHEAGLQMATMVDPNSNASGNVMSELLDVLGTMAFFVLNVHHYLLSILAMLMEAWPVGGALPVFSAEDVARRVSQAHQTGMLAVLPAAACLFVTMCGLLILMRSTPQFTLFSIGQSLRVGVGLLATLMFLPHMLTVMVRAVFKMLAEFGLHPV